MTDTNYLIIANQVLSKYAMRSGMLQSTIQRAADDLEAIGGNQPPLAVLGVIRDLRRVLAECESTP